MKACVRVFYGILMVSRSTQNHEKQRFSPPKTWFLGTKNKVFDGFGCSRMVLIVLLG